MQTPQPSPSQPSKPPEWFDQNPHAKISFSRLAVFRRCPAWYRYQYLEWNKAWSPPVTRAGHAVQEAFERLVEWSPSVGLSSAALLEEAQTQGRQFFEPVWEGVHADHESDPNSVGEWDLSIERYAGYLANAVKLHMEEVVARQECRHPRTGKALELEPVADLTVAWQQVKPLHAPTGVPLGGMESVPGGYFQGEFDLVYDWTGARRIVDLKASGGDSAFSTEIELQLTAYAWLEGTLGRGRPEGLEAWFLASDEPRLFAVPEPAKLEAFANEVLELLDRSGYLRGFGAWRPDQFPIDPAPVPGQEPRVGDPSAWCRYCPNAPACSASVTTAPPAEPGIAFTDLSASGRVSIHGTIMGVGQVMQKRDKTTRRFTVANVSGARSFTWDNAVVARLVDEGLRAGRTVLIENLNPWKHPGSGDILLYPTPSTRLTRLP